MFILYIKILFGKTKQADPFSKFEPLLPLDIKFFSDPTDPPTDPVDPPAAPPTDPPNKIEFTPEQQAELDRILGERLGKEQAKWEKDYQSKLEAAKTEAEKLAKMNADQKAEYERQKREDELAKRESEITRRELRATALETLADKSLPLSLAEILVFTDAASTNASLDAVEKSFREAVEAGVNERLRGGNPPGGGGKGNGEVSVGANFAKSLNEKSKPIATTLWT
ncbi:phage capsid protein [Solibacillus sp. R5-41]|nr:phage capsid protein [Solibacillus sp. R5-41]